MSRGPRTFVGAFGMDSAGAGSYRVTLGCYPPEPEVGAAAAYEVESIALLTARGDVAQGWVPLADLARWESDARGYEITDAAMERELVALVLGTIARPAW